MIEAEVGVTEGRFRTVAAVNVVAQIQAAVYDDTVANDGDSALLRVIHASPDAGPVDLTLADGTVLAGNVTFPNATGYLEVDPGTYNLQLRAAGTNTVVRDFRNVQVAAGDTLSAVALGLVQQGSFSVNVLVDDAASGSSFAELPATLTTFRAAHLSPGTPNVDVEVDGTVILTNVAYPAVGAYLTTPSRSGVTVRILQTGTTTELLSATLDLPFDQAITVAAVGSSADANVALNVYNDDRSTAAGQSRARAVHASPNAPNVDVPSLPARSTWSPTRPSPPPVPT